MESLARLNRKLADEKTGLQTELAGLEDLVQAIKNENNHLKISLKANQHALETVAKVELECEDLKSDKSLVEERYIQPFIALFFWLRIFLKNITQHWQVF